MDGRGAWSKTAPRRHRDIIGAEQKFCQIRADTRVKLLNAIARGRQ
jgi:hypothetical protein